MTREQMLEVIRESCRERNVPPEKQAAAEKEINDFFDRKDAGLISPSKTEQPQQKQ